jgi:hypothetical protein
VKKNVIARDQQALGSSGRRDLMKGAGAMALSGMFPGVHRDCSGAAAASAAMLATCPRRPGSGFLYQPSKGMFWDPSVIYANSQYYMYTMYLPERNPTGQATRVWLATSKDGVHWKDYGVVLHEQGFKNNTVWKQYYAKVGDRYIMNHGAFADGGFTNANGGNNLLRFYESSDLVHWHYIYDIPLDTRLYEAKGRWDHMWMMPRNPASPAEGYLGYMVADPIHHGGFGMMESPDGIHYRPIPAPEILAAFQIPTLEVGGAAKLGDRYYALGGNVCHYGFFGYGVYTYVAESPMGPFRPDLDAYRLCGTSGIDGDYYIDILAAFVKDSPEPLLSAPFSFRGAPETNGEGVWFLPMRKGVVDTQGHLRLAYWEQNDLAKGAELKVDVSQHTVVFPPGQTASNPIVRVVTAGASLLVATDKSWRGFPWLNAARMRKGVVVLNQRFDLDRGLIIEGHIKARELNSRLQNAKKTYAGFYIEGVEAGPGTAIMLEVGEPQWRESLVGGVRLDTEFHFAPLDRTGMNCATVTGLHAARDHGFRLWIRGGQMELYIDGMLMQSFFIHSPSGRVGVICQESEAQISQLRFYEMNLADGN